MAIKSRLRSIENRVGAVPCECKVDRWDGELKVINLETGETEAPAEVCPKCGREKKRVVVKFVYEGHDGCGVSMNTYVARVPLAKPSPYIRVGAREMAIKARLKSIESRIGVVECECRNEKIGIITVQPGDTELTARVCPKCGKGIMMIVVRHAERGMWGGRNSEVA